MLQAALAAKAAKERGFRAPGVEDARRTQTRPEVAVQHLAGLMILSSGRFAIEHRKYLREAFDSLDERIW
jgi:hypothetical protein